MTPQSPKSMNSVPPKEHKSYITPTHTTKTEAKTTFLSLPREIRQNILYMGEDWFLKCWSIVPDFPAFFHWERKVENSVNNNRIYSFLKSCAVMYQIDMRLVHPVMREDIEYIAELLPDELWALWSKCVNGLHRIINTRISGSEVRSSRLGFSRNWGLGSEIFVFVL